MPLIQANARRRFSEAGPYPQVLAMGRGVAVMLLCLRDEQRLQPPADDAAETVFTVLGGEGRILEGDDIHSARTGDVVHVAPGRAKALIAGEGEFVVLGVRTLRGRGAEDEDE